MINYVFAKSDMKVDYFMTFISYDKYYTVP